jgi:hypothetical protein
MVETVLIPYITSGVEIIVPYEVGDEYIYFLAACY